MEGTEGIHRRRLWSTSLESLWAGLSGDDAPRAYRALLTLAAEPSHVIPLLAARLRPDETAPGQLTRWMAELGSDSFSTRASASAGQEELGEAIGPALWKGWKPVPGPRLGGRWKTCSPLRVES